MKDTQLLAERQLEVNGRGAFLSRFVASGSNCSPWCGQELGRFGAVWGALGWCSGARWRSVTIWGVLGHSGALWGVLGRSGALWGVLGRSGALWGGLGCGEHLENRNASCNFWILKHFPKNTRDIFSKSTKLQKTLLFSKNPKI